MNQVQWKKTQIAIRNFLSSDSPLTLEKLQDKHRGAFLAILDNNGIVAEAKTLQTQDFDLLDLSETINKLATELKGTEISNNSSIHLCIVKDAIFLKNPLDWKYTDGLCFQWGNRYQGYLMPYEMARMSGDKVRILDRLCCYKAKMPAFWRLPCGLVWRLAVEWFQ